MPSSQWTATFTKNEAARALLDFARESSRYQVPPHGQVWLDVDGDEVVVRVVDPYFPSPSQPGPVAVPDIDSEEPA